MKVLLRFIAIGMFFCSLAACAGSSDGTGADGEKKPKKRSSRVITADELATSNSVTPNQSVYDAVQYLRPNFLIPKAVGGTTSSNRYPIVYVDNVKRGDINELRSIYVADVSEIRYLSASEATMKYGANHSAGAIALTSRAR